MRFGGSLKKDGRFWVINVPAMDLTTQGKTKTEAYEMIADAIESLVNAKGFSVQVYKGRDNYFEVGSDDPSLLIALALKRMRNLAGLSLNDVAKRLGSESKNSYARYERGTTSPTVEQLGRLLEAVDQRPFVFMPSKADTTVT